MRAWCSCCRDHGVADAAVSEFCAVASGALRASAVSRVTSDHASTTCSALHLACCPTLLCVHMICRIARCAQPRCAAHAQNSLSHTRPRQHRASVAMRSVRQAPLRVSNSAALTRPFGHYLFPAVPTSADVVQHCYAERALCTRATAGACCMHALHCCTDASACGNHISACSTMILRLQQHTYAALEIQYIQGGAALSKPVRRHRCFP